MNSKQKSMLRERITTEIREPALRRFLLDELDRGTHTEIYRLDGRWPGEPPIFFNVSRMRAWAERHGKISHTPTDDQNAEFILRHGGIDEEHFRNHTIRRSGFKPVIICKNIDGANRIIDGAYTYLAGCAAAALAHRLLYIPCYVEKQSQWKKFIIPSQVTLKIVS
jgi:hypothetical protein